MTCQGCGNQIPNEYLSNSKFACPSCGKVYHRKTPPSLSSVAQTSKVNATMKQKKAHVQTQSTMLPNKPYWKKNGYIMAILIMLIVALGTFCFRKESSVTLDIDGEWYCSGYVNFDNLVYFGMIPSGEDWNNEIIYDFVEPLSNGLTIKIDNGTIVENGSTGTISKTSTESLQYESDFESDGEHFGNSIVKCGQQLHFLGLGEVYIYSAVGTTPEWLLEDGNTQPKINTTHEPSGSYVTGRPIVVNTTVKPTVKPTNKVSESKPSKVNTTNNVQKEPLIAILILVAILIVIIYIRGQVTKCPECRRKFAMKEITRKTINTRATTMDIKREVRNRDGKVTHTYYESVPATEYTYECVDECKFCGHRRHVIRIRTERD